MAEDMDDIRDRLNDEIDALRKERDELVALLAESSTLLEDTAECLENMPFATAQLKSMAKRNRAALGERTG